MIYGHDMGQIQTLILHLSAKAQYFMSMWINHYAMAAFSMLQTSLLRTAMLHVCSECPLHELTNALSLWIIHLHIELYKSILPSTRHSALDPPKRGILLPSVILMIAIVSVLKVWPRFKQGLMEFLCFAFVHVQSSDTGFSTNLDI